MPICMASCSKHALSPAPSEKQILQRQSGVVSVEGVNYKDAQAEVWVAEDWGFDEHGVQWCLCVCLLAQGTFFFPGRSSVRPNPSFLHMHMTT